MGQQLYLNRSAVCIALELVNDDQLAEARAKQIPGAQTAAVGSFLVMQPGSAPRIQSADSFAQHWGRPDALLSPQHAALIQGVADLDVGTGQAPSPLPSAGAALDAPAPAPAPDAG